MSLERISIPVFDLGIAPYVPLQALQRRLQEAVIEGTLPGVILLLEHEPVITLGARATPEDLSPALRRTSHRIPVERSDRGGRATLHAPGQLLTYPIVRVPGHSLREYVHGLEEILIVLLEGYGVKASRRDKRPGLYVDGAKIASIGLRCRRWVAAHGSSLNVGVDLSLFDLIVSCGEPDLHQTSLEALTRLPHAMSIVKERYLQAAEQVFGWDLAPVERLPYEEVERALGL